MTRCLIKLKLIPCSHHGFTLTEMMIAVAFSVLLLTGVYSFYVTSSQSYSSGIAGQTLQSAANTILNKIVEGESESGTIYRLSTAFSYQIPDGTAGHLYTCGGASTATPCNATTTFSELYFCQLTNPVVACSSANATARWYYLNSTGTTVFYHHPKSGGGTVEETIFKAPTNTTITLRFSPATAVPANVVEVDVALVTTLAARVTNKVLATTGSASTFVLLRNHP